MVDAQFIKEQRERIAASNAFGRAPRMARLFNYLVVEELEGRGDKIKGYSVGVDALDKPDSFNPSIDASVRVEVGRLRRMLHVYYANHPKEKINISIPKGSNRPQFSANDSDVQQKLADTIIPSIGPSVAILPFSMESPEDHLFAIGLRAELLNELFRYRELHIVDAFSVADESDNATIERCRQECECEYIVQCRIYHTATNNVALLSVIDTETQQVVWTNRYFSDSSSLNVMHASYQMAVDIAQELAKPSGFIPVSALRKRMRKGSERWTATDCILRFHLYRLRDRTPTAHAALTEQIQKLLQSDPMFAFGYAIYSMLKIDEVAYMFNNSHGAEQTLRYALNLAIQGISIDPDHALGHFMKARCHYFLGEKNNFRTSAEKAIELHPGNCDLLHHVGSFFCYFGDWEEGIALIDQAGMDYHSGIGYRIATIVIEYYRGDTNRGKALFETAHIPDNFFAAHLVGALIYVKCGEWDEAASQLRRARAIESRLSPDLSQEAALWFKDTELRNTILEDLRTLSLRDNVMRLSE